MSKFLLIFLIFLLLACKNSQVNATDNRLYHHVDSLITQVLNYEYNENSFRKPYVRDTTSRHTTNGLYPSHLTMSLNPEPVILVDGYLTTKEDLKKLPYRTVKEIDLMEPSDTTAALYGTRGSNGAVIIKTAKFKRRKRTTSNKR